MNTVFDQRLIRFPNTCSDINISRDSQSLRLIYYTECKLTDNRASSVSNNYYIQRTKRKFHERLCEENKPIPVIDVNISGGECNLK